MALASHANRSSFKGFSCKPMHPPSSGSKHIAGYQAHLKINIDRPDQSNHYHDQLLSIKKPLKNNLNWQRACVYPEDAVRYHRFLRATRCAFGSYDMDAIVNGVNSKKQRDTSPVSDTIPYKLGTRPNLCWSTLAYGFCIIAG